MLSRAADRFKANTLAIDGSGKLSGKATLANTGLPNGDYLVVVADGVSEARRTIAVTAYVPPGARSVQLTPAEGPLGTTTMVTGANWTPNTYLNLSQVDADGYAGPGTISVMTDQMGSFGTPFTVTSEATTHIRVREGISSTKRVLVQRW